MEVSFDKVLDKFTKVLKKSNLRMTEQRKKLLELIFDSHDHFTAEELYDRCKARDLGVSKATVYRSLTLLTEAEMLEAHNFAQNALVYEHIYEHEHHDHLVCTECSKVVEFTCEAIEKYQRDVAKENRFTFESHSLNIFGLCPDCQRKQKSK
ncbi:MAG: transcriptional repressor [Planctomycetes bacterium]|nr:transcriptional repressor [Planctomycetota bacterium]